MKQQSMVRKYKLMKMTIAEYKKLKETPEIREWKRKFQQFYYGWRKDFRQQEKPVYERNEIYDGKGWF